MPGPFVNFDGLSFPLDKPLVVLDADEGPIEGAGITWNENCVTVELKLRGMEPLHFSVVENEQGKYNIVLPEFQLEGQIIEPTDD